MKKILKLSLCLVLSLAMLIVAFGCNPKKDPAPGPTDQTIVDYFADNLVMTTNISSNSVAMPTLGTTANVATLKTNFRTLLSGEYEDWLWENYTSVDDNNALDESAITEYIENIFSNFTFSISSQDESIVSNNGTVVRGMNDVNVDVDAILTLREVSASKTFTLKINLDTALVTAYINEAIEGFELPAVVEDDFGLPQLDPAYSDVTLTYTSSNSNAISIDGNTTGVIGERAILSDVSVVITLTAARGSIKVTKSYSLLVEGRSPETDAEIIEADMLKAYYVPRFVLENFTLPIVGEYGSTISYEVGTRANMEVDAGSGSSYGTFTIDNSTGAATITRTARGSEYPVTVTFTCGSESKSRVEYIQKPVTVANAAAGSNSAAIYIRPSKQDIASMFYIELDENENVILCVNGVAFASSTATTRTTQVGITFQSGDPCTWANFQLAMDGSSTWQAGTAVLYDNCNVEPNSKEFSVKINLTEIYGRFDASADMANDWIKVYIRLTEDSSTGWVMLRPVQSTRAGDGMDFATTGEGLETLQALTDVNGDNWRVDFAWRQIHLRKNA